MIITPLETNGNSSKFRVTTKNSEFDIALSFTLRTKIWQLEGPEAELVAAQDLAEAIVSRHDPSLPFEKLYILAEHNVPPTLDQTLKQIRKNGI